MAQELLEALAGGRDLRPSEEGLELLAHCAPSLGESGKIVDQDRIDGCSRPPPQHRAQFRLGVEGEAVIDSCHTAGTRAQHVSPFAVGVVDDRIE